MFAGPPDQSAAWSDTGVEGALPLPAPAVGLRGAGTPTRVRARRRRDRRRHRRAAKALRREVHALLRQVSYDYDRLQYNTVVSGAMKLLNALEEARARRQRGRARGAARRPSASCCACSTRPARTSRTRCGTSSATPTQLGDLLDAPWPQVDEAALRAGRDRAGAAGQRQAARRDPRAGRRRQGARSRPPRCAAPEFARFAEGKRAEEGRSSCRAGWSTSWSDAVTTPLRCSPLRPALLAAGCGFELRRAPELRFRTHRARRLRAALAAGRRAAAQHRARTTTRVVDSAGAGPGRAARRSTTRARRAWSRAPPPARCARCSCARACSFRLRTPRRPRADRRRPRSLLSRDMSYTETPRWRRSRRRRSCSARCRATSSRRCCAGWPRCSA